MHTVKKNQQTKKNRWGNIWDNELPTHLFNGFKFDGFRCLQGPALIVHAPLIRILMMAL